MAPTNSPISPASASLNLSVDGQQLLALDLSQFANQKSNHFNRIEWKGTVTALRLSFADATPGTRVRIRRIGLADMPPAPPPPACASSPSPAKNRVLSQRMAAWHETILAMSETQAVATLGTYIKDKTLGDDRGQLLGLLMSRYTLLPLVPNLERDGGLIPFSKSTEIAVDDFPGGVRAVATLDGVNVTAEFMPLHTGRDSSAQDGAALSARPHRPAHARRPAYRRRGFTLCRLVQTPGPLPQDKFQIDDSLAVLTTERHSFAVAIKGGDRQTVEDKPPPAARCSPSASIRARATSSSVSPQILSPRGISLPSIPPAPPGK